MSNSENYVVIGSNSFSGSYLVDTLLEDPSNFVIGISRSPEKSALYLPYKTRLSHNFNFYQVDIVRETEKLIALLDNLQPTYIINFAALSEVFLSHFRPFEYFQTNCLATVNLCNALRDRHFLRGYIHISSAEVYGTCEDCIAETGRLNPSTPYAASKAAADLYLMTLAKYFDFPVILVRSTNVYGKHQQLYKIIPRTIIYLKTGRKIGLHGGGKVIKSFIHIRDVVRGVIQAMRLGKPGEVYHFSTENGMTVEEVVKRICELMGYDFKTHTVAVEERLGQDARYLLNCAKAQHELEWSPQVPLEDGLKEVIGWIEGNWEAISREPLIYIHRP